jgi:hypothetical protein
MQIELGTVLAGRAGPNVAALINNLVHLGGLVASVPTFKALPRIPSYPAHSSHRYFCLSIAIPETPVKICLRIKMRSKP